MTGFENISQLLLHAAVAQPQHGFRFYAPGGLQGDGQFISYADFTVRVTRLASVLQSMKLHPDSIVLIHLDQHQSSIEWFWAVTFAGLTPAILPPLPNHERQRMEHIVYINQLLENPLCLTLKSLSAQFSCDKRMHTLLVETLLSELDSSTSDTQDQTRSQQNSLNVQSCPGALKSSSDTASLMLTSGSSGRSKAVVLTHRMMLHSMAGKKRVNGTHDLSPFLNWIGLDHVASLTEIVIHAIYVGATQIHVQATDMIPEPLKFLDLIQRHRIAYTFAPHFFLAALQRSCDSAVRGDETLGFDLKCLRTVVTGGEANFVDTCVILTNLFVSFGAARNVLSPAFGMTETCAGSIYSKEFPECDLESHSEVASVGYPVSGLKIRITDDSGVVLGYDVAGHLELQGSMVFDRYLNNPHATREAFSDDGWFRTGDTAKLDARNRLHLVGRSKDILIINGVNRAPEEVEICLEGIEGIRPSYAVAVPYRAQGAATESLCIVYLPTFDALDRQSRVETNDRISKAVMTEVGVRPLVIPLDETSLQKSTLGKLSRSKIHKALLTDEYRSYITFDSEQTEIYLKETYQAPTTKLEKALLKIVKDSVGFEDANVGIDQNIFSLGVSSIELLAIRKALERQMDVEIPLLTMMTNPTVRSLVRAVGETQHQHEYNPIAVLQNKGTKTPLWLIHPGVGEILVFLPLASHFTDRPIYALRARGFESSEIPFGHWQEARDTYIQAIKSVQPHGPYAIAGYSFGSMIAFEMTKILKSRGDEVGFLGVFNLPPNIKDRMRELDWTNCILHLSYFLGFFDESVAHRLLPEMRTLTKQEVADYVLSIAPPDRIREVDLNAQKLLKWTDLAYSLQSSAVDYEPSGIVSSMDIFCAIPLASAAKDFQDWRENRLRQWTSYCETEPIMHDVDGAHYTMMSSEHVLTFQRKLKAALAARDL